jgi:MYXO-CTERM domain-containing protein
MRRTIAFRALLCGLGCCAAAGSAQAETLFSFSGQVALADGLAPDGVKVKLQVDLDRNGKLDSFETLSAKVASDGSYTLKYDLNPKDVDLKFLTFVGGVIADYQARGFESLLDDGPLPVILSFEREGYGTVVRRLNTLFESPTLDVSLAPLGDVQCAGATCLSPDGGVRLSEFPAGTKIARAYADAYDPSQETSRFPGLFTDRSNNLLVSSGFAEINLYQEDGTAVHQVSSAVTTRFEAKRASWSTLPDLEPNSGRIELPMYSFDQASGEWVAEGDGELQLADGQVVSEDELTAIHDGSYDKQVFVAFATKHFSTFNCDAPISVRGCVKGRIVAKGTLTAMAGVSVSVNGVSYTGSAGTIITGALGTFATDVRKSELPSEDLDSNGSKGETLEAQVVASGTGVFVADAFETPTVQGSVGQASRPGCKPAECDCLDLGDIEVEFEEPRLCELTVEALFSGLDVVGEGGPLAPGDAVAGATVRASLVGGVQIPQAAVTAVCAGADCGPGLVPASGTTTFAVPVIGEQPQIQLDASWSVNEGGTLHYYSGSLVVPGCKRDETAAAEPGSVILDHSAVTGLGDFISSLGDLIKTPVASPGASDSKDPNKPFGAGGCGCHVAGGPSSHGPSALVGIGLLLGSWFSRRRQRC